MARELQEQSTAGGPAVLLAPTALQGQMGPSAKDLQGFGFAP